MTQFPNFGLINQLSRQMSTNTTPKVLDYQVDNVNGYTYIPTSTDLVHSYIPYNNSAISQQQRFNSIANELMYMNRSDTNDDAITKNIINQSSVLNSLVNPNNQLTENNARTEFNRSLLNTTANKGIIKENDSSSNNQSTNNDMNTVANDRVNKNVYVNDVLYIVVWILIAFMIFMIIQMYLSQKKLEFMMSIYSNVNRRPISYDELNSDMFYNA